MIPDQNLLYASSSFVNALTSLSLGLFIFLKNPRSKLHQLWWWMSLSIALWAMGLVGMFLLGPDHYPQALLLNRISQMAAIFIPLLYFHFIVAFVDYLGYQRLLRAFYVAAILLAFSNFTPLFVQGLESGAGIVNYTRGGSLYVYFFALYLLEPLLAIRLLWKKRRETTGFRRNQLTHVMLAGIVGFLVGATMFPLCFGIPIPPVGGHVVWLYCLFVAWAIFKYQLFEIHVVVRRSIVYSLLITFLTAGYFGLVYGVERALQITFGYRTIWVSLGAFALMTLAFQPLKASIQRAVDWLIFRVPQEELARRMERLEQQALQSEKFKAVSTLAAGMAHEIKNPLTAIRTFTEFILERHKDPDFARKLYEVFSTETKRMQELVQDLLTFAKPKTPQLQPVDLAPLIASPLPLLSSQLSKHRIQWAVDCQHNGAAIHADPDQFRQVLINLIQNAADAMPDGGQLKIATQAVNSHLELTVSDTGSGIPPALLPKIFDPFVTTKPDGNGLGLAMVYSILQAHRGSIRATSQPNRGTTFTVSLPL